MKKLLTLLHCILAFNCFAQNTLPILSKQQMYADYDTLIMALTKINPHNFIRQQVNNYAQSDSIIALRKQIDTISSTASFFWLVNTALNFCQDGHTSIRGKSTYSFIDSLDKVKWHSTINDTATIQAYSNLYNATVSAYKLNLPIKYLSGKYIVLAAFKYKNKEIPANAILTACNNKEINAYVNGLQGSLKNMHWDFGHKRFYAENFYTALNHSANANIDLSFLFKQTLIKATFNLSDTIKIEKPLKYAQHEEEGSVKYFQNGKILYIRMPIMRNGDFYVSRIDSVTKLNAVSKIIFDVRDNAGGSDPEWAKVITHLINKPIIRRVISCGNIENPRRDRWFDEPIPAIKPYVNSFAKQPVYQLISDDADTLLSDKNALNFTKRFLFYKTKTVFLPQGTLFLRANFLTSW